ncbi:type III-A CRISPR-associated protein Cas10/Csm1 [archaeon]|nr:type III-A CRISPR-associated protein Cas10/Csm1 [Acholeplasmataceae bacterium]MCK9293257.1 type III-A CRISPR-associated protein Cas10/Csm1 [archaeon]MCK9439460.1 type III-A CRISPR-associated protein Cas10/Csm1 [Patescibacteria group bacterium]
MDKNKHKLIIGSLLHDIGKINYRALDLKMIKSHSIAGFEWLKNIDDNIFDLSNIGSMIKHHHFNKMPDYGKGMKADDLAFITSIADHISAGGDRRQKEDFSDVDFQESQTKISLESVFSNINPKSKAHFGYKVTDLGISKEIIYPLENQKIEDSDYNQVLIRLGNLFTNKDLFVDEKNINSLVSIIKTLFKYLPSDTRYQMKNDISLAEHSLTTAAFASCLYDYFQEQKLTNYYDLWKNEKKLFSQKTFLFTSFDFSGIQKFVFDIPVEGALRNLRVRSFYLEMMGEILVDQILASLELSRANVIYVGGGHGYLMLPNTKKAKEEFNKIISGFNEFLLTEYDYNLYLTKSLVEVSADELISMKNGEFTDDFSKVMMETFKQTSLEKQNKYNFDILNKLNKRTHKQNERECSVCGKTAKLSKKDGLDTCESCLQFNLFSSILVKEENKYFVLTKDQFKEKEGLTFPYLDNKASLYAFNEKEFKKTIENNDIIFSYIKNDFKVFEKHSTNIFIADYFVKDKYNNQLAIDKIVELEEKGIKRIAVMKLDVDSLGEVFKSGFDKKLYTISRMTSLSNHLSLYFKYYLNKLLENLNITVIFSGGDDAFLFGTFKDILDFSKVIYESFKKYTLGKLTFSASIGLFPVKYPIYKIADYMEDLLLNSKSVAGKNSVTIFEEGNTFNWNNFFKILGNESSSNYKLINDVMEKKLISNTTLYNYFYKILKDLKENEQRKVHQLAYVLGRRRKELSKELENETNNKLFTELTNKLLKAANYKNKETRTELLLAIQVYMYLNREK